MSYLSAIVAMSENRVIGKNNQLPWHLPADLKHFKDVTMGKPIIMGRKTFESIGKPLPGRKNIIITRDRSFYAEACTVTHTIEDALAAVPQNEDAFVIGGAEIFQEMWNKINKIYLTIIHAQIDGDAFFPEINRKEWHEVAREDHKPDEKNHYSYSFITLVK